MAKVVLEKADFDRINRPANALRALNTEQQFDEQAKGIIANLHALIGNMVQKAFDEGRRFESNNRRG